MPKMDTGLAVYLSDYYTELYVQMCLEQKNLVTPEIMQSYREWLNTPEGSYYKNYKYNN